MKLLIIVGARPNFIKVAPLIEEIKRHNRLTKSSSNLVTKSLNNQITYTLVHTGQHYDYEMSQIFFQDLKIPKPDYNLGVGLAPYHAKGFGVGSGSHAWQTAKIMEELEPVILKEKPNLVVVVGDVNSTLAGALVAAKLSIPVAHIEAGLRSFDKTMPEEINRRLADHISDFLFVTEPAGVKNLLNEGISRKKICLAGDIMIDALIKSKDKIRKSTILKKLNLKKKEYAVLTLHRPANVDDKKILSILISAFNEIQKKIKIIYPVHPRAEKQIKKFGFKTYLKKMKNFIMTSPIGYIDMMKLVRESKFLMTDSGGLQEETTFLKVPCLTLRDNTERPITIEKGTNILCKRNRNKILKEVNKILTGKEKKGQIPKLWDGKTAERIMKILCQKKKD